MPTIADQGIADEPDGLDVSGIEDVVMATATVYRLFFAVSSTVATDVIISM